MRQHQRRPLQLLDDVRHRERLARAGDAHEHLLAAPSCSPRTSDSMAAADRRPARTVLRVGIPRGASSIDYARTVRVRQSRRTGRLSDQSERCHQVALTSNQLASSGIGSKYGRIRSSVRGPMPPTRAGPPARGTPRSPRRSAINRSASVWPDARQLDQFRPLRPVHVDLKFRHQRRRPIDRRSSRRDARHAAPTPPPTAPERPPPARPTVRLVARPQQVVRRRWSGEGVITDSGGRGRQAAGAVQTW